MVVTFFVVLGGGALRARHAVLAIPKSRRAGRGVPLMGRLSGFLVTLRQMGKPRLTTAVPAREASEAEPPPRPSCAQPVRGRHGEVHRLRVVRRCVPGAVHLRARRRQPHRRPGVPRRALRLRLRDQLSAVHPLRPVRRGVPHRSDHRDEAVRVLVRRPQRRDLHEGPVARRRQRSRASNAVGAVVRRRRRSHERVGACDCAVGLRSVRRSRIWSGELGYGVRPAEGGQSDRVPGDAEEAPHFDEKEPSS